MSTICAISTPYGSGGIAVVRVSGESAIQIVDTLFHGRKSLTEAKAYTVHYGEIKKPTPIPSLKGRENNEQEILDQVLVSVFRAPHSFTGEDVVEIACHGSMYIQQTLLQWLVDAGCQLAKAGEFTQRAFLNGKMDLSRAEAVADIIASDSMWSHNVASTQMRGGYSDTLNSLRNKLIELTSLLELELDFGEEDVVFADRSRLEQMLIATMEVVEKLKNSFHTGNAIRNGVGVAIIGAPNVGKSTLLNRLVGEQRAMVSDIAGTTRDTIEESIVIDGIRFRFIDTAGIRKRGKIYENADKYALIRAVDAIGRSDIVLLVLDAERGIIEQDKHVASYLIEQSKACIIVVNKWDTIEDKDMEMKKWKKYIIFYCYEMWF